MTTDEQSVDTTPSVTNWESAGLPIKDFDGAEFVILTQKNDNAAQTWRMIAPEEQTGDNLNDAMYNRNKKIEEIYNIKISSYYSSSLKNDASNSINSGDNAYSAILGQISDTYSLAQEGKFYNFYDIDHIDLDAQWWDQSVIEGLTYNGTLYNLTGDISPATNARIYTLVFNKDLCSELGLEMPYQYVLDGTWTIDRFSKYISDVNHDVNGDSIMDYEDRWGFFSQDGCSWMMYFAGGGQVTSKDKSGNLSVSYDTERNIRLATEALEIAFDKTKTLMANKYVTDNNGSWAAATAWFASGKALFRSSVLEPIPRDLRSLDVNFGIVPFPKLDENQSQYYTLPEEYSIMLSIPITADAEFAGLILESLAAESVSTVSLAFYDVCLNGKVVRDEESKAMLDIIFKNKIFDIGYFANIGNFRTMLANLEKAGSTNVASSYASSLSTAEAALKKITDNFDSIK
ncbi:MAG: extracellular solute-binding protein [Clostridiales bacterium]|nr:extracellular solute-binding protein [Clostridiales bacterium]